MAEARFETSLCYDRRLMRGFASRCLPACGKGRPGNSAKTPSSRLSSGHPAASATRYVSPPHLPARGPAMLTLHDGNHGSAVVPSSPSARSDWEACRSRRCWPLAAAADSPSLLYRQIGDLPLSAGRAEPVRDLRPQDGRPGRHSHRHGAICDLAAGRPASAPR